jgi:hypothetical protein
MLISNNIIFDSVAAQGGQWRNISNFIALSIHVIGLEGTVKIEASNDPAVMENGPNILAPSAPTLSSVLTTPPASNAATYHAKVTYVTANGGETTASGASSAQVVAGANTLFVDSPAQDVGGEAVGYNVYIQKGASLYQLQNTQYNTFGAGNVVHNGPIPIGQPFMLYVYNNSNIIPPVANTSGSINSGIAITGDLTNTDPSLTDEIAIFYTGSDAMINPSCLAWNFIRVVKTGGGAVKTQAFLLGQNG